MACKVLSIAFKTFGLYYLQSVLRPLILDLMKTQEFDYEVDPTRLQNHSNLQSNRTRLLQVVTSFYETILNSLPSLPLQLRTVCHILYQVQRNIVYRVLFIIVSRPFIINRVLFIIVSDPLLYTGSCSLLFQDPLLYTWSCSSLFQDPLLYTGSCSLLFQDPLLYTGSCSLLFQDPLLSTGSC